MATTEGYGSVTWWGFSPALDIFAGNPPQETVEAGELSDGWNESGSFFVEKRNVVCYVLFVCLFVCWCLQSMSTSSWWGVAT